MARDLKVSINLEDNASKSVKEIKKEVEKLGKSVDDTNKKTSGLSKAFGAAVGPSKQLLTGLSVGFAAAGAAAVGFGVAMYDAMQKQKELTKLNNIIGNQRVFEEMRTFAGEAGVSVEKLIEQGTALGKAYQPERALQLFKSLTDLQKKGILNDATIGQASEAFVELASKSRIGLADVQKFQKIFGKEIDVKLGKDGTADVDELLKSVLKITGLPAGEFAKKFALGDVDSQIENIKTTISNFKTNLFTALFGDGNEGARKMAEFNDKLKELTSPEAIRGFIENLKSFKDVAIVVGSALLVALLPALVSVTIAAASAAAAFLLPLLPLIALGALIGLIIVKWDDIVDYMKTIPDKLSKLGKNIVDGLWDGIKKGWEFLLRNFKSLTDLLPKSIKKLLGISSPSKVFKNIGKEIVRGLSGGLVENRSSLFTTMRSIGQGSVASYTTGYNNAAAKASMDAVATVNSAASYKPLNQKNTSVVNNKNVNNNINFKMDVKPGAVVGDQTEQNIIVAIQSAFTDILNKQQLG